MQFKIGDNVLAKCVDKNGRCIFQAAKVLKITSKGINIKYQDGFNRINVPFKEIRKAPTLANNIVSLKETLQTSMASPSQQTSSTKHLPPSISHQSSPSLNKKLFSQIVQEKQLTPTPTSSIALQSMTSATKTKTWKTPKRENIIKKKKIHHQKKN